MLKICYSFIKYYQFVRCTRMFLICVSIISMQAICQKQSNVSNFDLDLKNNGDSFNLNPMAIQQQHLDLSLFEEKFRFANSKQLSYSVPIYSRVNAQKVTSFKETLTKRIYLVIEYKAEMKTKTVYTLMMPFIYLIFLNYSVFVDVYSSLKCLSVPPLSQLHNFKCVVSNHPSYSTCNIIPVDQITLFTEPIPLYSLPFSQHLPDFFFCLTDLLFPSVSHLLCPACLCHLCILPPI